MFKFLGKPVDQQAPEAEVPRALGATLDTSEIGDWYSPVLIGSATVGEYARSSECLAVATDVTGALAEDAYHRFLLAFYREGASRSGTHWRYADISTVLVAASTLARPQRYLEIGVRRGRSMAMVSSASPACDFVGFDLWVEDYAGLENPGPDFVRSELERLGHTGELQFVAGDSRETVPAYLEQNPNKFFDLVTVDGDHSREGAIADLETVIPRLAVGGILVFDDILHPVHPELRQVWSETMVRHPELKSWEYTDIGYGVAVAVRTR